MILIDNKEVSSIRFSNQVGVKIYKGILLVWEAIKSCFGAGFWKNDAPWVNNDGWKNN